MSRFDTEYTIRSITYASARSFLSKHHYLAQQGNGFLCKVSYGLFDHVLHMIGVITWGGYLLSKPL